MKKLALFVAVGLMGLSACQENKSYTIQGTISGANDGEYVYLETIKTNTILFDTAIVKEGRFTFKGEPVDALNTRYVNYTSPKVKMGAMLFLEKGNIQVHLDAKGSTISGTESNDALAAFTKKTAEFTAEMQGLCKRCLFDTTISAEQRKVMEKQVTDLSQAQTDYIFEQTKTNAGKLFGVYLLKKFGMDYSVEKIAPLLEQIPAEYATDAKIVKLKEHVKNTLNSAEGEKFVDFSMKTPEGTEVKLSDIVSKNKYTLVDFWASWCGPCCNEMPNVVKVYAQFKDKGLDIVGVSLDQEAEKWQKAIKDLNMTWTQLSDLKGWKNEAAKLYSVRSIPSTLLIDQQGNIVARDLRGKGLSDKLEELFK